MSMPCDGPPCTCGAAVMQTGKGRLEGAPELTPFEVEVLGLLLPENSKKWDAILDAAEEIEPWQAATDRLVDLNLVNVVDYYTTAAGRGVLAALGVS